jgi:hypothetical protein
MYLWNSIWTIDKRKMWSAAEQRGTKRRCFNRTQQVVDDLMYYSDVVECVEKSIVQFPLDLVVIIVNFCFTETEFLQDVEHCTMLTREEHCRLQAPHFLATVAIDEAQLNKGIDEALLRHEALRKRNARFLCQER